ncbi:hypothetical protein [Nocardia araoensis]|uniref:hypothetical protein n=1 Tax=Nocardia araoensis TaxID=228600 RepID=UPI00058459D6|nr:hypothetical protein [Nocardia araoensis]
MSLFKSATPLRRLAGVAVAGALITLPLGALAATASAETPAAPGVVQVVDAPQQVADHDRQFDRDGRRDDQGRGPDNGPGHGPDNGPDRGPNDGPRQDGPAPQQQFLPPTGSS